MTTPEHEQPRNDIVPMTRRRFIAGAGASVLACTILKPELVRGAAANSKINIGLIGCGGRGTLHAGRHDRDEGDRGERDRGAGEREGEPGSVDGAESA